MWLSLFLTLKVYQTTFEGLVNVKIKLDAQSSLRSQMSLIKILVKKSFKKLEV